MALHGPGKHNRTEALPSLITAVPGEVKRIHATSDSLLWSAPSGYPSDCPLQYTISLAANPAIQHIVAATEVSSSALKSAGFPYCTVQAVTVTPTVTVTGTPLNGSTATAQVAIRDPGTYVEA